MHRSRIGLVLIDHPVESYDAALAFWAEVQGVDAEPMEPPEDAPAGEVTTYTSVGRIGSVHVEAQRTGSGTTPRLHFDIETDDVAAEVARVVSLGATVREQRDDYTILEDPGGLVFCVVPVQTGDLFAADARTWD